MDSRPSLTLEQSIVAAQAWWREAGVDFAFHDRPAPWLVDEATTTVPTAAAAAPEASAAPKSPAMGGDPSAWPQDLASFREWWLAEPSLDESGPHPRVAPRGPVDAPLMMLVPMPEPGDHETLLAGANGRLLASLALAMGLAEKQIYFAAVMPCHTTLPHWEQLAESGCSEILRHHIGLANPARLIVFGNSILPLLGHDPAQAAPAISEIDIHSRQVPVLATFAPERLLGNARQRAGLWHRWLEWTDREGS